MGILNPDFVFNNVSEITPEFLKINGIEGVVLDLDGTLCHSKSSTPPEYLERWLAALRDGGIKILMLSNNKSIERVEGFCAAYNIKVYRHRAKKPFRWGFKWAIEQLKTEGGRIGMIGDQIFTDVLGGNLSGMKTFYVHSIDKTRILARIRYMAEKPFIKCTQKCRNALENVCKNNKTGKK